VISPVILVPRREQRPRRGTLGIGRAGSGKLGERLLDLRPATVPENAGVDQPGVDRCDEISL